jgi:membrane-bound lytic murein transglycosylase D
LLLFSFSASPLGADDTAPATPSPFPLPAGLEPAVEFWKRIFSEYSISQVVYFDDISARSSVGALGIWQFMPRTGRQYLRMGRGIDERRDPLESSRAAAAYLSEAYDRLGSWPLAITSYNYGQGGMARAVDEVGSSNLVDLIEKYNHPNWGFPPKQFYAEFLAAVEIGTNLERYFPGLELDTPAHIKEVEVTRSTPLRTLIKSSGLSHSDFLGWNPALSANTATVPAGYRVKLPTNRSLEPLVVLAKNEPPPAAKPRVQVVHHRVKHGETLYDIARRYGASVQRIAQVNGLRRTHLLRVGSTLRIPQL